MFETKKFVPKYFIGWIPSSLLLSIVIGSSEGLGFIVFYTLGLCFAGLFFLGLSYLITKFKKEVPIQWEIVWYCYPPISILVFAWSIFRAITKI